MLDSSLKIVHYFVNPGDNEKYFDLENTQEFKSYASNFADGRFTYTKHGLEMIRYLELLREQDITNLYIFEPIWEAQKIIHLLCFLINV